MPVKSVKNKSLMQEIWASIIEVLLSVIKRRVIYYLIKIPGYLGVFAPWFLILAIPLKDLPFADTLLNLVFYGILILSGRINDETINFITIAMAGINLMFIVGLIAELYERITHKESTITPTKNLEIRKYIMVSGWAVFAATVAIQQREPKLLVLAIPIFFFYQIYKFEKTILGLGYFKKQR